MLLAEGAALVPCLWIAVFHQGPDVPAFIWTIALAAAVGLPLALIRADLGDVGYREGFMVAAIGWVVLAAFGSLPFIFSGVLPNPVDAFFEAMSGFTTTGASTIADLTPVPYGILFWRSLTHWLGGMGIVVFIVALLPSLKVAGIQLYRAEVPGPSKIKVVPRVAQTSRELYRVYLLFTLAEILLLRLAGLPWFDSLIHTFGTVATGGFSNQNASVGAYNNLAVELIIVMFMILCGMSFSLHIRAIKGHYRAIWQDTELRVYLAIIAVAVAAVTLNLVSSLGLAPAQAARHALFQVASIITTTGFSTVDFNLWPDFSRLILVLLMFIGGCAGSTGGAIKVVRFIILWKVAIRQLRRLIHPQAVLPVRLGGAVIPSEMVDIVQAFFILYLGLFSGSVIIVAAGGADFLTALTAVAATLGNVGPGLGLVGPMSNFAALPDLAKALLSFCMLVGRLELFTVLALLHPGFWRR
ncbi:MAG: TrkH family potassium uptake protein [Bacillota bacterium]|nr:TrkH family potassium uptake protein [Bacillota bacterium]